MKWRELILCLLEVHSIGLGRSLARLQCRRLSLTLPQRPPPPTPPPPFFSPPPLPLSLSLSLRDSSPPADTRPAVTERGVLRAAEAGIELTSFPRIKDEGGGKKISPTLVRRRNGEGQVDSLAGGRRGNCCSLLRHNSKSRFPHHSYLTIVKACVMIWYLMRKSK